MQQSLDTTSFGIMLKAVIIHAQQKEYKLKKCRYTTHCHEKHHIHKLKDIPPSNKEVEKIQAVIYKYFVSVNTKKQEELFKQKYDHATK